MGPCGARGRSEMPYCRARVVSFEINTALARPTECPLCPRRLPFRWRAADFDRYYVPLLQRPQRAHSAEPAPACLHGERRPRSFTLMFAASSWDNNLSATTFAVKVATLLAKLRTRSASMKEPRTDVRELAARLTHSTP